MKDVYLSSARIGALVKMQLFTIFALNAEAPLVKSKAFLLELLFELVVRVDVFE